MRLTAERVWIVDPLDGTASSPLDRDDWAVHVALWEGNWWPGRSHCRGAGRHPAPLRGLGSPRPRGAPRILVSAPAAGGCDAGARRLAPTCRDGFSRGQRWPVVQGRAECTSTPAANTEWDSRAGRGGAGRGLHTSRVDGSPLRYNQSDPLLPDVVVCRPEFADAILTALR